MNAMDYKTTIERILGIEQAMDVTAIRYKGLHLWPYVRMQLWQRLLRPNQYAPPAAIGLQRLAHKLSKGFFRPDFYTPYLEHAKRHRDNIARLNRYGPVDVMFFSREEEHEDVLGGQHFNRYIDPLIDLVKNHHTFIKLELITDRTEHTVPRFEYTHFFDSLDYLRCDAQRSVIAAFQDTANFSAIENGRKLADLLAGTRFDLALTEEYLMMEGERMLHYIRYFRELLSVVRPRVVFLRRYFDNIGMALVAACKTLGIVTVNIQSARQGSYHGMYSHWQNVPDKGYEMLPDFSWCWGKPSAVDVRQVKRGVSQHLRPVIGGHPWLARWLARGYAGLALDTDAHTFLSGLKAYQKVILITLQRSDTKIPGVVVEAMRKAPADWYWLIRLHPEARSKTDNVISSLEELHIKNADVEQATHLPLYLLMSHCHRHITQWSTTALECLRFGVPTILVHPIGKKVYAEHATAGLFSYGGNAEQIIDALYEPLAGLVEEPPFIETSRMYALTALREIMAEAPEERMPIERKALPAPKNMARTVASENEVEEEKPEVVEVSAKPVETTLPGPRPSIAEKQPA